MKLEDNVKDKRRYVLSCLNNSTFTHLSLQKDYRRYKECPVKGCTAKPQKKLSNHLKGKHPNLTEEQRQRALKNARVVADPRVRKFVPRIKGQLSLRGFTREVVEVEECDYAKLESAGMATRHFPMFVLNEGQPIDDFLSWLQTADGRNRTLKEASQIAVDVSKALHFVSKVFSWESLINQRSLREYLDTCKRAGVGPKGLQTKCERLVTALMYLKLEKTDVRDVRRRAELEATTERIEAWKKVYRLKGKEVAAYNMAKDVDKQWDLGELTAIVRCEDVWEDFETTVANPHPADSDPKLATAAISAMLLFGSAQRPGAVLEATVDEYASARQYGDVWVITVREHKNSQKGPARLTMDSHGFQRLTQYVTTL